MQPTLNDFFCLKDEYDGFRISAIRNAKMIFGDQRVKELVDQMLAASQISNKAPLLVWHGDYGCGKTHHLNYTRVTIKENSLPFKVVMFDCPDLIDKSEYNLLHYKLVDQIGFDYFQPLIKKQIRENPDWLDDMSFPQDVAIALEDLCSRNEKKAKDAWMYLAGKPTAKDSNIGVTKKELNESVEFAYVLSALAYVIKKQSDDKQTLLFLIDEAEGMQAITNKNAQTIWIKSLRRLVEIEYLGIIFSVGAQSARFIPQVFMAPEVVRRIGFDNYVSLEAYDFAEVEKFMKGLFGEFIHLEKLSKLETSNNLTSIANYDRTTFPFTSDALDGYCKFLVRDRTNAKPSEFLHKLQETTLQAVMSGTQIIDRTFLENRGEFA